MDWTTPASFQPSPILPEPPSSIGAFSFALPVQLQSSHLLAALVAVTKSCLYGRLLWSLYLPLAAMVNHIISLGPYFGPWLTNLTGTSHNF